MSARAPRRDARGRWERPGPPEPPYRPRHASGRPAAADEAYRPRHRKGD